MAGRHLDKASIPQMFVVHMKGVCINQVQEGELDVTREKADKVNVLTCGCALRRQNTGSPPDLVRARQHHEALAVLTPIHRFK